MTAAHTALAVLDEADYLAPSSPPDTEPAPADGVGCGCVPVFREAETPQPRSSPDLGFPHP